MPQSDKKSVRDAGYGTPGAFLAFAAVFVLLLLSTACDQIPGLGDPALPPGFADSQVPDVPLNAYLYLNQGEPITLAPKALDIQPPEGLPFEIPVPAADTISVWAGPEIGAAGGMVRMTSEEIAGLLYDAIKPEDPETWTTRQGAQIAIVHGAGEWSRSLQEALEIKKTVSFQEKYPNAWETVRLLPETPPNAPIAAGFVQVDEALVQALADQADVELGGFGSALDFIPVSNAAFGVYSAQPLDIPEEVDDRFLEAAGLRVVAVIRTRLPGFLISFLFNNLTGVVGLEREEIGSQEVLQFSREGITALVAPRGGVIYLVIAPGGLAEGEDILAYLPSQE